MAAHDRTRLTGPLRSFDPLSDAIGADAGTIPVIGASSGCLREEPDHVDAQVGATSRSNPLRQIGSVGLDDLTVPM